MVSATGGKSHGSLVESLLERWFLAGCASRIGEREREAPDISHFPCHRKACPQGECAACLITREEQLLEC